jgi:predicted amidohydrolase YtcJ
MRNPFRLTLLLVLAVSSAVLLPGRPQSGRTTAFVGARIIDGTGGRAIEDGALVVEGGRVRAVGSRDEVAIPEDAVRVDLGGRTVIPGLVNAHGHTNQNPEETLRVFARYGVTTVVSLGNEGAAQAALNEAQDGTLELDRARVYFAGPNLAGGVSQALPQVDDRAAMGADFVKIRLDSGQGAVDAAYRELMANGHRFPMRGLRRDFLQSAVADYTANGTGSANVNLDLPSRW